MRALVQRRRRRAALTYSLLVFFATGQAGWAQSEAGSSPAPSEDAELLEVDQSLSNLSVFTPSKKFETQSRAAAVVTVISAEDISDMGADTLYEVLAMVPGVEVVESFFGYTSVNFRGVLETHYNDKSLLLINGHPVYDTTNFSFYLESIPVAAVKRIEVVRGPGSVLYGTNAFAGVVNVLTWDPDDVRPAVRARARGGSFETVEGDTSGVIKAGDFFLHLALMGRWTSGYPFEVKRDEDGCPLAPGCEGTTLADYNPVDKHDYQNIFANGFVDARYKGFRLSGLVFANGKDKMGLTPAMVSTGQRDLVGFMGDLRWEERVTPALGVTVMAYADSIGKNELISWYPPSKAAATGINLDGSPRAAGITGAPERFTFSGFKAGAEARADWDFVESANLLAGLTYEHTRSNNYLAVYAEGADQLFPAEDSRNKVVGAVDPTAVIYSSPKSADNLAAFLRASWAPARGFELSGGLRAVYDPVNGVAVSPRAAIVWAVSDEVTLKGVYGRAYRDPSFFERFVETTNVLYGGDVQRLQPTAPYAPQPKAALTPELIDTVDASFDWRLGRNTVRLNAFWLKTQNLIARTGSAARLDATGNPTEVGGSVPQYANTTGYSVAGVEAEVRGQPIHALTYFVNASFRYPYLDSIAAKAPWRAPLLANLGVFWRLPAPVSRLKLGTTLSVVGPREGTLSASRNTVAYPAAFVSLPAYALWNASLSVDLPAGFAVAVQLHNLLNTRFSYPEYVRALVPEVPGGPPLAVYGQLSFAH